MVVYRCLYGAQDLIFTRPILGQRLACVARLTDSTTSRKNALSSAALTRLKCPGLGLRMKDRHFGISSNLTTSKVEKIERESCIEFSCSNARQIFDEHFELHNGFISESEADSLMKEVTKYFKGLRYEFDHWDDAIHGYRETEKSNWTEENSKIIQRVRDVAFEKSGSSQLNLVHVLDLAEEGFIKPHIDSVKFCGNVIAGISLLSPSVMKLVHESQTDVWAKVLLKPNSLYVLRDHVRYEFTHEILPNESSVFCGKNVQKNRRISVICRNHAN